MSNRDVTNNINKGSINVSMLVVTQVLFLSRYQLIKSQFSVCFKEWGYFFPSQKVNVTDDTID